jgi:putative ABC transport system permease protein
MLALKSALRSLAKSPGFSALVILIAALGIGANTAIFSVVRAVVLRPLPMDDPAKLVRLRENFAQGGGDETQLNLAPLTWQRWRQFNDVFTDIAVATGGSFTLTGAGDTAEFVPAALVSGNFFTVLGVKPILGRDFLPEEDRPGANAAVLISHGFWQRHFGGARNVVGRSIQLDGTPRVIVGVMPPEFRHPYRAELWVPIALGIDPAAPVGNYLYAPARLRPGVTLDQARRSLRDLCTRLAREYPGPNNPRGAWVMPLHESFVHDSAPKVVAISAAAFFVLLIAGANIASLLLARQTERGVDRAIRAALGASRRRLLLESLAHSLLLALAGSAAGILLAVWLTGPVFALSPMASDATGNAMREFDSSVRLDGAVLAVTTGLTLLVGLGFGLIPALRGAGGDLHLALKGGGRGATLDRRTRRTLGTLVVGEIAVAVVLLVATGLMIRSFRNLTREDWGFATESRLTFSVRFSERLRPEHTARVAYVRAALERLRALPGVVSAAATTPDLVARGYNLAAVTPQGSTPPEARGYFLTSHRLVEPGYFADAGIPIVRGRALAAIDQPGAPKVAVVSADFARRFWPGQDPIGRTIKRGRANDLRPAYVVVGVAADIKAISDENDGDIAGMWYLPYAQNPNFMADEIAFVVHTRVPPESLQAAVRKELAQVDPTIAPYDFSTLGRLTAGTYAEDRFALLLIGLFGVLGLLLAAIGLYGLLSFQIAWRTREIGLRAALGALRADILAMVFRDAAKLVLAGLALGAGAAYLATRLLRHQLHEVSPGDPLTYLLAAFVLAGTAAVACWLPARRATKVDPLVALRNE